MLFNHNNDIDDDLELSSEKKTTKKKKEEKLDISLFKGPLIILGVLVFVIIIIFLCSKLLSGNEFAYDEKLYFINLEGDNNITLYLGEEYIEPGYSGRDDSDNDLTSDIVVDNNVDINNIGNYHVTYTLGNVTKERNIKVIEKPTGATHIHLYGDVNVFLYVGEEYQEKGYEVINYGSDSNERVDYPVYAFKLCHDVISKNIDFGIAICKTGIGMSIAANRFKGIRHKNCA